MCFGSMAFGGVESACSLAFSLGGGLLFMLPKGVMSVMMKKKRS